MPGLVPGIHVFALRNEGVDGRDKPGHDENSFPVVPLSLVFGMDLVPAVFQSLHRVLEAVLGVIPLIGASGLQPLRRGFGVIPSLVDILPDLIAGAVHLVAPLVHFALRVAHVLVFFRAKIALGHRMDISGLRPRRRNTVDGKRRRCTGEHKAEAQPRDLRLFHDLLRDSCRLPNVRIMKAVPAFNRPIPWHHLRLSRKMTA